MKAFKGDHSLKAALLEQLRWHREQDRIIKGTYGDGLAPGEQFRGCAIGCSIHSLAIIRGENLDTSVHELLEEYLDVPRVLWHLEDSFFEALPEKVREEWPLKFAEAIPVDADLSMVVPQFLYWLLSDDADGVIQYAPEEKFPNVRKAILDIAGHLKRWIGGETIDQRVWINLRRAAAAAAAYAYAAAAAAAYAYAAAAYAAVAAAGAADAAAAYAYAAAAYAAVAAADAADAADAAERHRVREDARIHARVKQSEKLLEIIKAAPMAALQEIPR